MNVTHHSYRGEGDLAAMLMLKQRCTTPENLYDRPTTSDLRGLFVLFLAFATSANEKPSQAEAFPG